VTVQTRACSGRTNKNFTGEKEEKKLLSGVPDTEEVSHGAESRGVSARCRRCVLNILIKLQPYSHHSQVMSVAVNAKNVPSRGNELKFTIYV